MPWPRTGTFGVVENPIIESPFVENNSPGEEAPPQPGNRFLLLGGGNFLLLSGGDLLLLG